MEWLSDIKNAIPDYAKDIRLNLDATVSRSSLEGNDAIGVALAAAFAAKATKVVHAIREARALSPEEENAALTAASLMGMNNAWYPFVEMADDKDLSTQRAELRMNAYANHGGLDKRRFEMYALAASVVGKCHFCIQSHYALLKAEGMSTLQLRDVGRIAATINAVSQVLANEV